MEKTNPYIKQHYASLIKPCGCYYATALRTGLFLHPLSYDSFWCPAFASARFVLTRHDCTPPPLGPSCILYTLTKELGYTGPPKQNSTPVHVEAPTLSSIACHLPLVESGRSLCRSFRKSSGAKTGTVGLRNPRNTHNGTGHSSCHHQSHIGKMPGYESTWSPRKSSSCFEDAPGSSSREVMEFIFLPCYPYRDFD